jgi:N-acetylglucosamine-6-phosphate deacetylase
MGVSFPDAVRAASLTPANLHNLTDVGALRAGLRADLVAWEENLNVSGVVRAGEWVREI